MADREVEETLREIRERVRAAASQSPPPPATPAGAAAEALAAAVPHPAEANGRGGASDALSRMEANLSTTERAWNRLPPVLSNRGGWLARLELWVKRKIKRALHWITWEQVNFNSSVHHALRDARAALASHEQLLSRMQSAHEAALRQSKAEAEAERTRVDARLLEVGSRLAASEARLEAALSQLGRQLSSDVVRLRDEMRAHAESLSGAQGALVESWRGEQAALAEGLRAEQSARLAEFEGQVRERMAALLDEQRVCFRQLSLEAGEAAVMHDRARRQLEARLEALEGKAGEQSGV